MGELWGAWLERVSREAVVSERQCWNLGQRTCGECSQWPTGHGRGRQGATSQVWLHCKVKGKSLEVQNLTGLQGGVEDTAYLLVGCGALFPPRCCFQ